MTTRPIEWMRAVRDAAPKFTTAREHVLLMLALRMGPDGTGFASNRLLAADSNRSVDTVERATANARQRGYLRQSRRGHRVTDTTVLASEWVLLDPTQTRTGAVLEDDPNPQKTRPKPARVRPQENPLQENPRHARAREPERGLLVAAGAVDDEIDDIIGMIRRDHPEVRNLAAWLTTVSRNGDLAAVVATVRGQRAKAAWPTERDEFVASLTELPRCPHGVPGGNVPKPAGVHAGWRYCINCRVAARSST